MSKKKRHLKKINKAIAALVSEEWDFGYNVGYDAGSDVASSEYIDALMLGAQAEQDRIQKVLDMQIEWAMESGKGAEAIKFKQIKEILVPVKVDYSDEAYKEDIKREADYYG
jgi:hypothetical protein